MRLFLFVFLTLAFCGCGKSGGGDAAAPTVAPPVVVVPPNTITRWDIPWKATPMSAPSGVFQYDTVAYVQLPVWSYTHESNLNTVPIVSIVSNCSIYINTRFKDFGTVKLTASATGSNVYTGFGYAGGYEGPYQITLDWGNQTLTIVSMLTESRLTYALHPMSANG